MQRILKNNRILSLVTFLLFGSALFGQLTITNSKSAIQLVDGVLIPSGKVTSVSNVTMRGIFGNTIKDQAAYFSTTGATQTGLGLIMVFY